MSTCWNKHKKKKKKKKKTFNTNECYFRIFEKLN
jgi:hypothetical protein